ncbi:MAG TPA: PAS domain S-box protein [Deltaproteobacteria bacterium]|nr:PAS domain S-box protein [Deltaproteobacteria bacterium]
MTANTTRRRPLTVSDQNLLTGIASQLAVRITNAWFFEGIRQSEQRYRTIFESTSNPTIIIEEDTTISLANRPFEKLSGYTREELEHKKSWTEFIVPEDLEMMKQRHTMRRLNRESTEKTYEFRFCSRHGEVKNIFLTVDMIPDTTTSVASLLDISERIKAEEALKKSEERYRLLAENVHDVIWVLDKNFRYTYISPSVENLKGFTVDEAMAMALEEIYTQQSYETVKKVITEELEHHAVNGPDPARSRIFETEQICKDGSTVWTEITASILYDENGNISGFLGITRDISERKKAEYEKNLLEAQLQHAHKMEAIGTLAGGIAHDFNNLLMGIQGNASLLLADIDSDHPHAERLRNIERHVRGGADLTRQLLGFARGGKYEVKPTNINDLVGKSSEMFGRTRKEITIHLRFEKDIWTVEIDRGQIEQVMLNLYVNAWQAMEPGGEIFLETNNVVLHEEFVEPYHVKPGRYVHICVTDTGSGMDEETAKRVFEPFFTTKELRRGTGLGLASAYGIIVNHNGIIDVSSRKGKGSTFNIYLPASQKAVSEENPITPRFVEGSGTVLIVDDEDMILDIGKEIIERMGYTVITAKGGKAALKTYRENHSSIDLVILDMIMPDLTGGETYDALKEIDPGVKVLLSSGYSLESMAKDILKRGCDGFIQKPFDLKALSVKIHEIIEG